MAQRFSVLCLAACLAFVAGGRSAAHADSPSSEAARPSEAAAETIGLAVWRGASFDGRTTASGERFDMYQLTAASAQLPLNSYAAVTNVATGQTVVVRIVDRPTEAAGALISLAYAAAHRLGADVAAATTVKVVALGAAPASASPSGSASTAPPQDPTMIRPWLPGPRLASLDEALCADAFDVADAGGLRAVFHARAPHRDLLVSWADELPAPLSGL
jgi:hypothetical protein